MIASSGTVLSNLSYLIGAVVVAIVVGILVWLRHRQPKSVDANMASFKRGLSVLAPDARSSANVSRPAGSSPRPVQVLTHVKLEAYTNDGRPGPATSSSSPEGSSGPETNGAGAEEATGTEFGEGPG